MSEKNGIYVKYACEDGGDYDLCQQKNNACAAYLNRDVILWELLRGPK